MSLVGTRKLYMFSPRAAMGHAIRKQRECLIAHTVLNLEAGK